MLQGDKFNIQHLGCSQLGFTAWLCPQRKVVGATQVAFPGAANSHLDWTAHYYCRRKWGWKENWWLMNEITNRGSMYKALAPLNTKRVANLKQLRTIDGLLYIRGQRPRRALNNMHGSWRRWTVPVRILAGKKQPFRQVRHLVCQQHICVTLTNMYCRRYSIMYCMSGKTKSNTRKKKKDKRIVGSK
jgi:hypothetical protein